MTRKTKTKAAIGAMSSASNPELVPPKDQPKKATKRRRDARKDLQAGD